MLILSQFENRFQLRLEPDCTITIVHLNRLNEKESAIFVSLMCSLLPKDLHSELIFIITAAGVV